MVRDVGGALFVIWDHFLQNYKVELSHFLMIFRKMELSKNSQTLTKPYNIKILVKVLRIL